MFRRFRRLVSYMTSQHVIWEREKAGNKCACSDLNIALAQALDGLPFSVGPAVSILAEWVFPKKNNDTNSNETVVIGSIVAEI